MWWPQPCCRFCETRPCSCHSCSFSLSHILFFFPTAEYFMRSLLQYKDPVLLYGLSTSLISIPCIILILLIISNKSLGQIIWLLSHRATLALLSPLKNNAISLISVILSLITSSSPEGFKLWLVKPLREKSSV